MPTFTYRASDRQGQTIDGVMEAPDARGVVERLQRDAYFPIRIAPQAERRSVLSLGFSGFSRARVSHRDVLAFMHQFGTLVEAGLPLDRALVILEDLAPNPRLRGIVGRPELLVGRKQVRCLVHGQPPRRLHARS